MNSKLFAIALIGCTTLAFGQAFEGAVSGGPTFLGGGSITQSLSGVPGALDPLKLNNGWNLGFRMTVNAYSHLGFEVGYIYNRTHLVVGGADSGGMAIHDGFGDAVFYATKDAFRIRPFLAGGLNFSNFVLPGQSSQYGQGQNKFGFNYGAGIKVRVVGSWQIRLDLRQFNTAKPDFGLHGISGRLLQTQISVGFGVAF